MALHRRGLWLPDSSRSNNLTPPPIGADGVLYTVSCEGKVLALGTGGAAAGETGTGEEGRPPIRKR